ncbi:MAG: ATP-dependent RecD-like DNA helicase [Proteobacteria bacterium]|nr:ATP-dependent RecD-like DNA helicase [Pseudomonadota bacterium]
MNYPTNPYSSPETLSGSVERVTFHSESSGFCVLRTKAKGHRDLVTVVANAASISAGEYIECKGFWVNDKTHGLQFKAHELKATQPTTIDGIEKYLASGMIKGIGPYFAKKLIFAFGDSVFDVIETEPDRLTELEGIGKYRQKCITDSWNEQKSIRNIMVFLQSHGVGTARAVRIYKTYGDESVDKVQENPYRLALDIYGIGFKTADSLALQLGIAKDSLIRAEAGVRHVLQELCNFGHCAAEYDHLVAETTKLLEVSETLVEEAIHAELKNENIIADQQDDKKIIFSTPLYQAETGASEQLKRLNQNSPPWGIIDIEKAIPWVEEKTGLQLSDSQKNALSIVLKNKLSIITGGPGVGKTTLVNSFLKIIRAKTQSVALAAPTGRAAKRLTETTGMTAKTIHRLLEFNPHGMTFKHDQNNPLPIDVLVIDESSMLDIVLFYRLLKSIPDHAAVIFVGDVDQLPSVGPGAVLSDLIQSHMIATVRLTEIFRQASDSKIIINAHRINQGEMPLSNETSTDFYTIYEDEPETIHDQLIQLVSKRIPDKFSYNPVRDIQVLCPMNRGGLGSRGLNVELQKQLNGHSEPKINRYGSIFSPGDKIIQNINNYDKEVFNGDIGFIKHIDLEESLVKIQFDDRIVNYDFTELDEISLAYAISIHKSQGSEFPVVIIPLAMQHYNLLVRNLLYTGVTRGKRLMILIGQKKAIGMAVHNFRATHRITKLADRLKNTL